MIQFIILLHFIIFTNSKVFQENIPLTKFRYSWIYLTKMHLDQGQVKIDIQTYFTGPKNSNLENLKIGILNHVEWQKQLDNKCFNSNHKIITHPVSNSGIKSFSFERIQIKQKQTYYFVIKDCEGKYSQQYSNDQCHLNLLLTITNNNSHISSDQQLLTVFPIFLFIGFYLVYRIKSSYSDQQGYNWIKILIFGANVTWVSAIFWKGMQHYFIVQQGIQSFAFDFFYLVIKSVSDTILLCLLVFISYGWTINYKNNKNMDLYVLLTSMFGFIGVILSIFTKINDNEHDKDHMFDSISGIILIGYRFMILIVFLAGLYITVPITQSKKKNFYYSFGPLGIFYISSLPILLLLADSISSKSGQQKLILMSIQISHSLTLVCITFMVTHKKASYYQILNNSFLNNKQF